MSEDGELECLWLEDGAWYDIDVSKCRVKDDPSGAHLEVCYKQDDDEEDLDIVQREDISKRIRPVSEPVQDNNCTQLCEGRRITSLFNKGSEAKYYDAVILRAHRVAHGHGDGECTCEFTLEWQPPHWILGPDAAAMVPRGAVKTDIGQICFVSQRPDLHPKVQAWIAEIDRLNALRSPPANQGSQRQQEAADVLMALRTKPKQRDSPANGSFDTSGNQHQDSRPSSSLPKITAEYPLLDSPFPSDDKGGISALLAAASIVAKEPPAGNATASSAQAPSQAAVVAMDTKKTVPPSVVPEGIAPVRTTGPAVQAVASMPAATAPGGSPKHQTHRGFSKDLRLKVPQMSITVKELSAIARQFSLKRFELSLETRLALLSAVTAEDAGLDRCSKSWQEAITKLQQQFEVHMPSSSGAPVNGRQAAAQAAPKHAWAPSVPRFVASTPAVKTTALSPAGNAAPALSRMVSSSQPNGGTTPGHAGSQASAKPQSLVTTTLSTGQPRASHGAPQEASGAPMQQRQAPAAPHAALNREVSTSGPSDAIPTRRPVAAPHPSSGAGPGKAATGVGQTGGTAAVTTSAAAQQSAMPPSGVAMHPGGTAQPHQGPATAGPANKPAQHLAGAGAALGKRAADSELAGPAAKVAAVDTQQRMQVATAGAAGVAAQRPGSTAAAASSQPTVFEHLGLQLVRAVQIRLAAASQAATRAGAQGNKQGAHNPA